MMMLNFELKFQDGKMPSIPNYQISLETIYYYYNNNNITLFQSAITIYYINTP